MIRRLIPICTLICAFVLTAAPVQAAIPPDTDCRSGEASITFDDGPHKTNTPRLLKVLRKNHAQATFFVEGRHAKRHPALLREMIRDGHAVENHSWDHPEFTRKSNKKISNEIAHTTKVITDATGVTPTHMRPPYGDTDDRVRKVIEKQGLKQELWTIDTNDWRGGKSPKITKAALHGLRKHKANVILMHDAADNSSQTIKAVPAIISGLRKKGYCLVPLQVTAKRSTLRSSPVSVDEGDDKSSTVTVRFALDSPSQRDASFRWHTRSGSAIAGKDFESAHGVMSIKRGESSATARIKVLADPMPDAANGFSVIIDRPSKVAVASASVPITITDNGDWQYAVGELIAPL